MLEQQRLFAITARRQFCRVRCRVGCDMKDLDCAIGQHFFVREQSRCAIRESTLSGDKVASTVVDS